jgi:hypothetical protein
VVKRSPNLSFRAYLLSAACRRDWGSGPSHYAESNGNLFGRMLRSDIETLPQLLKWARERYPEQYRNYDFWNECSGREQTLKLWAKYLAWRDAQV